MRLPIALLCACVSLWPLPCYASAADTSVADSASQDSTLATPHSALATPDSAHRHLAPTLIAARDFALHGVRLGISRTELLGVFPRAKRMADLVTGGAVGFVDAARGMEKWKVTRGASPARVAYFVLHDSVLFNMNWQYDGGKGRFETVRDSAVAALGTPHVRDGNTLTWISDVVHRRITVNYQYEIGTTVEVTDTRTVAELLEGR